MGNVTLKYDNNSINVESMGMILGRSKIVSMYNGNLIFKKIDVPNYGDNYVLYNLLVDYTKIDLDDLVIKYEDYDISLKYLYDNWDLYNLAYSDINDKYFKLGIKALFNIRVCKGIKNTMSIEVVVMKRPNMWLDFRPRILDISIEDLLINDKNNGIQVTSD